MVMSAPLAAPAAPDASVRPKRFTMTYTPSAEGKVQHVFVFGHPRGISRRKCSRPGGRPPPLVMTLFHRFSRRYGVVKADGCRLRPWMLFLLKPQNAYNAKPRSASTVISPGGAPSPRCPGLPRSPRRPRFFLGGSEVLPPAPGFPARLRGLSHGRTSFAVVGRCANSPLQVTYSHLDIASRVFEQAYRSPAKTCVTGGKSP